MLKNISSILYRSHFKTNSNTEEVVDINIATIIEEVNIGDEVNTVMAGIIEEGVIIIEAEVREVVDFSNNNHLT